jgi:gluconolactonase
MSFAERFLIPGLCCMTLCCGGGSSSDDDSQQPSAGKGGTSATGGTGAIAGKGGTGGTGGSGALPATGGMAGAHAGTGGSGALGGSGSGGMPPMAGTGGTAAGMGGTAAVAGSGGSGAGGAGAGAGAGGSGGDAGGSNSGGAGAGGSGGSSMGWTCPPGTTGTPTLSGTPKRITSVPPPDSFNMNNGTFGNVEGPVWIGDALYVSELSSTPYDSANSNTVKSRILKVTSDGMASVFIADSGSNGLAVDAMGNIVGAVHKDGSITRFTMPSGSPATAIVSMYGGKRFNSPNDLAIRSDGTIYFSDPSFQAPNTKPQPQTYAYRVPPGGQAEPIPSAASPDILDNPNGMTLSLAEDYLYVASGTGKRYPVKADGSLGAGETFAPAAGGDGMTIDCAGNLYVAQTNSTNINVYTPSGTKIGSLSVSDLQAVTNVAFGGSDHKTLYITGLGNNKGLFSITLNIPGRPY